MKNDLREFLKMYRDGMLPSVVVASLVPMIVFMIGGLLYIVGIVAWPIFVSAADSSGASFLSVVVLAPFLAIYAAQIGVWLVALWFVLRSAAQWSKSGIILAAIISPVLILVCWSLVGNLFGYTTDLQTTSGIIEICIIGLLPVIYGAIAYNDIHYRLPRFLADSPRTHQ
jgi:hypothetical protein